MSYYILKIGSICWTLFIFNYIVLSSTLGLGRCPRFVSMDEFNVSKFSGQWFEVERSFYLIELPSSCTSINLTENNRGNLDVTINSVNRWTNSSRSTIGVAIPMVKDSSIMRFKITTKLPYSFARWLPVAGMYTIIYTDFENFAIVWSCSNFGLGYTDGFWILGRSRDIPASKRIDIYNIIRRYNLDPERLTLSKNENCV